MIATPTTFVIGAGASHAFGLPTAPQLRSKATGLVPRSTMYQLLIASGTVKPQAVNEFLEDLRQHPAPSIDAFLESRQHDETAMRIGHLLIAILMADSLLADLKRRPGDQDWLGYIIERMRRGASRTWQEFANRNAGLRFITFNFDTVIETRLRDAFRAIFRGLVSEADVESAMSAFPILHVHGELPPLPSSPPMPDPFGQFPKEWLDWPERAASALRVVTDEIDPDTVVAAHDGMRSAEIVCFLGFAYAPENLTRLSLPKAFQGRSPSIYGSAYGMRHGEQAWVIGRLPTITLGSMQGTCLDILRDFHIFRD
jgi:hypothetical protein